MFEYLRDNPKQLIIGIGAMIILIILIIAILDVKFRILDDPHQKKQKETSR